MHFLRQAFYRLRAEYCCYCRKNGVFVQDCTIEEMVEFCLQYDPAAAMDKEEAKKQKCAV